MFPEIVLAGSRCSASEGERILDGFASIGRVEAELSRAQDAPPKCLDVEQSKIIWKWEGRRVLAWFGGLNGEITFKGVGLTLLAKQEEASVAAMLASGVMVEVNGILLPNFTELLKPPTWW